MDLRTVKHIIIYFLVFLLIIGLTSTFTAKEFVGMAKEVGLSGQDITRMQAQLNGSIPIENKQEQPDKEEKDDLPEIVLPDESEEVEKEFQKGDTGEEIKELQSILQQLGYLKTKPDGMFGSMTESAIMEYQRDNQLEVTGKLDAATIKSLNAKKDEEQDNSQQEEQSTNTDNGENKEHIVQAGESLSVISEKYNVSIEAILKANNFTQTTVIQIGQKIIIPQGNTQEDVQQSTETENNSLKEHTVKQGETLSNIGQAYGVSVSDILKANNLTETSIIRPGQTITIPNN